MQINNLTSTNFKGLSAKYKLDSTLKLNENIIFSEQDLFIPKNESFIELNDNKINNFSNLYLTKNNLLTSAVYINPLKKLEDEGFSTYFAVNSLGTITPDSRFWIVAEPGISTNIADVSADGDLSGLNNSYLFDVELIDEQFCKITHENNNVTRYLTVDYTGNLTFTKDAGLDALGPLCPQLFYYVYDRDYDYFLIIKNINDIPKFVNVSGNKLTLTDPLTGTAIPYSVSSIFRLRPRNPIPNTTDVYDPWVSYRKDLKTNSQNINENRSFSNINSNLLLHSEFFNLTGNSLDVNILSLKNTNTSENFQSRNNPLFNENSVEFREYQSIFSGTNQIYGDDNITLGYESYTTNILLKKDKVTYFHIPENFYPFQQLNVADSGLIQAGAIAGDHPIKSDKIFKKKADYKYTSYFGDSKEENSGQFLCTWLSGSTDIDTSPIWVDRYYNPKNVSFLKALTASDFKAIKYISLFDCLVDKAKEILGDVDVFDKPSDLIFEKGTYYAYYHYGPVGVNNFIKTLSDRLIEQKPEKFVYFNGANAAPSLEDVNEFTFNGKVYASTSSLSSINDTNTFTLLFDAFSEDWTKPMGYQLIGNYDRDGFGIFNENIITPTFFITGLSSLKITNSSIDLLNNLTFNANIVASIRRQGLDDFYLIFDDNTFRRYNLSYNETRRNSFSRLGNLVSLDYIEDKAFALVDSGTGDKLVYLLNLYTHEITNITGQTGSNGLYPARFLTAFPSRGVNKTINYYNGKLYLTPGNKAERIQDKIFFQPDTRRILVWDNITTNSVATTAFYSQTSIDDFSIDFEGNVWLLFDATKYAKYTSDRKFILSGALPDPSYFNFKVDFQAEFINGEYKKYAVLTAQKVLATDSINFYKIDIETGKLIETNSIKANVLFNNNLTNSSFLRTFIKEKYETSQINIKAKLVNMIDSNDIVSPEIKLDLTLLDPGYHSFAVRFDSYNGRIYLFVDGQPAGYGLNGNLGYDTFSPRKYKFSNIIYKPFLYGSASYAYSIPLFSYLKNTNYLVNNLSLKNIYLYNKALFDFDIMHHARQNMNIEDLRFDVACGRRNYLEEIERYFKLSPPSSKSTLYNLVIRNSGITDMILRDELEKRILNIINSSAPVYTKLNKIIWSN